MKAVRVLIFLLLVSVVATGTGCMGNTAPQGFSGIVSSGDTLFVGAAAGKVLVVDPDARASGSAFPSNGEWEYAITTPSRGFGCRSSEVAATVYGVPVAGTGQVCVGTYEGKVLMLDEASRESNMVFPQVRSGEWIYPRADEELGPIIGSPAVAADTVFVSSSTTEDRRTVGRVYALDRRYGDELWVSGPLDGKLWATPSVSDGSGYVSTFDGHSYSLSATTGELLPWSYESEVGFVSSPLVAGGMVYVGTFDRFLYAIQLGAEEPRWQFEGENWFWGAPVLVGEVMYAPCLDGKLYALDAASGKPVWDEPFDAGAAIAASPAVVGDSLVVANKAGDVYFVNTATGNGTRVPNAADEKKATCDAMVVASPCYHQDTVYIRAQNNVLYGIDPVSKKVEFTFSLKME